MKLAYCPDCDRDVTPRKEITSRAKEQNIPVEELGRDPSALTTYWTKRWKCPRCNHILKDGR